MFSPEAIFPPSFRRLRCWGFHSLLQNIQFFSVERQRQSRLGIRFRSTGSFCLRLTPAVILKRSRTQKSHQKLADFSLSHIFFSKQQLNSASSGSAPVRKQPFLQKARLSGRGTNSEEPPTPCTNKPPRSAGYTRTIPQRQKYQLPHLYPCPFVGISGDSTLR